jgi:hypothetical protein
MNSDGLPVEDFEIEVEGSFQSRVVSNYPNKSLPGVIAELTPNINFLGESLESLLTDDNEVFSDAWYLHNNELLETPIRGPGPCREQDRTIAAPLTLSWLQEDV